MKNAIVFVILFLVTAFTYGQDISIKWDKLYPEGTAYSKKRNTFFISSIYHGQVGTLDFKGNYKPFTHDPELIASVGILADDKTNTLYVTNVDNGVAIKTSPATAYKLSQIIAYDLISGERKFHVDLGKLNAGQPNFINDLTMDNNGNLYVTNSFSPLIFKIDVNHKATVFARSEQWTGESFNLNGIVFHPDGFLMVAQSNKGAVYKVDINNPADITTIRIDQVAGVDGMILNNKNELILVSNKVSKVFKLTTTDNWSSGQIVQSKDSVLPFPTTGVLTNGKYYILNGKLSELFDPNASKSSSFLLQEIKF